MRVWYNEGPPSLNQVVTFILYIILGVTGNQPIQSFRYEDVLSPPSDEQLKAPLAAATGPWLLILIQSLGLQEAQERPLDISDWIKPEEYEPDAKQVNAKEWAGLFVT